MAKLGFVTNHKKTQLNQCYAHRDSLCRRDILLMDNTFMSWDGSSFCMLSKYMNVPDFNLIERG